MDNEVSIIINGTRYDSVDVGNNKIDGDCDYCNIFKECQMFELTSFCSYYVGEGKHFKISTKSFEP